MRARLYMVGVGGQGTLTAARVLGEAALAADLNVIISEVHGMAQRGGVVETAILIGQVHSPLIGDGEADVLMGFEPLETLRALSKASRHTWVITNTKPIIPSTVKLGQGQYPDLREILSRIRSSAGSVIALNAEDLAQQAGALIAANMVMLGALVATEQLPFPGEHVRDAITRLSPRYAAINLKAFELGKAYVIQHQEEPDDGWDRIRAGRASQAA
ncbi:MAG: indolepyruvate ferredoxin oxidoreductase subunit beta [Candidatus Fraserbacteria bacterium RBG_16_55_9]|uniref:Indolepyruvate ferredoxin oxidoreductase subunit beta n=1 Tax=Fraserbacteria sp. (strain RBG_16_55_9) TaxID=1817864 RepID=A0A1F5UYV3_FRAXR|nr:MAG: indolepyruvate ferredoxin oxidoreductase subunit beta [Candidatus Fraserbacteria bacterium RBG_16_55_9]